MTEPPGPAPRRLPAPWRMVEIPGGYMVQTADGRPLVHVYGRERVQSALPDMLTKDEARRIAVAIARLPELLKAGG
jgi:hypothetical protein